MSKKIISKVGKRHRPEIDMMEYMQNEELNEFDLDKELFDDKPVKKKYPKDAEVDIEQNGEFTEIIED